MKKRIKNTIRYASNLLPYSALEGNSLPPKIVLYHAVENIQPFYIKGYQVKSISSFKKDLDFILKKYKPVDFEEIIKPPHKNDLIHLTFDDGLKSCYTNIAPILKQKGVPASFFINPSFIGNNQVYHRFEFDFVKQVLTDLDPKYKNYTNKKQLHELAEIKGISIKKLPQDHAPYMNMEEIKSLQNDGFLIGGHSMDHPEFYRISDDEQYRQIESSMHWIQQHLNPHLKVFAFPYTDYGIKNKTLQKAIENNLIDFSLGTAGLKYDIFPSHFQRIPMEPFTLTSAKQILKYEHFYFKLRSIIRKNTVIRK